MNLQTKQDFTALAMRFLSPLLPLYSPGGALLHLGDTGATYPQRTIGMEAFSRPLWALAPLWAGGGRASARETIGRVAAGAVARAVLKQAFPGMEVIAWVDQVHHVKASVDWEAVTASVIESNIVRTADPSAAEAMIAAIKEARDAGNSLGGVVKCVVRGCPPGLGDPVFDKLDATLAHAMMSIPATKAFAVGSGFEAADMTGLEHNDPFYMRDGHVHTVTNHSGGIQGGISNGEDILMRIGFKPTATLMVDQQTVNQAGEDARLKGRGRHDACVLPRAVPIVEAMAWLCLCDHYLRQRCQQAL